MYRVQKKLWVVKKSFWSLFWLPLSFENTPRNDTTISKNTISKGLKSCVVRSLSELFLHSVFVLPFTDVLLSPKVIYKRFNIACPFGDDHHNQTSFHDHVHINATDDQCEAKMFTVNSQVRGRNMFTLLASAFSWIVLRVFISLQVHRHAFSSGACCVSTEVCCVNSSVGDETSVSLCCLLDFKKMLCSLFLLTFSVFGC